MTSAIDDKTIEALAKQIGINTKLDQLGLNLGYDFAAIDIYKANNHSGGMVTYQGTRQMLKEWRHETPQEQQRPKLRKALEDSGLVMLAEKYLEDTIGEADVAPEQTGKRESETHRDDTPSPKHDFDDMLKIVARKLRQDSEIDTLGRKLGFDPEDIYGYIATNNKTQNVTWDGTLQMLRDWRKHQTKSTERSALKKALEQAEQSHLADDLFH